MRKILKFLIVSIGVVFFAGCSTDSNEDRYPYYKFNSEDELLIIKYNYVPDQVITYKNQFGEEIQFKVNLNERKKRGYYSQGTFSGGGGILENYYDSKIIRIEIIENQGIAGGSGDYSAVNYVFSKNADEFNYGLNFPMWNVTLFSFINEIQDNVNIYLSNYNHGTRISSMINGHLFENVIIIDSESEESKNSSLFGPLIQNVNQILYDYDFGIIQFNDIDGKEWKVVYPE